MAPGFFPGFLPVVLPVFLPVFLPVVLPGFLPGKSPQGTPSPEETGAQGEAPPEKIGVRGTLPRGMGPRLPFSSPLSPHGLGRFLCWEADSPAARTAGGRTAQ